MTPLKPNKARWALPFLLGLGVSAVWGQTIDASTVTRILQYEALLGAPLKAPVALCVDEKLGLNWQMPPDALEDRAQPKIEELRRVSETCTVQHSDQPSRLAHDIRQMLERQLRRAAQLAKPLNEARSCVTNSLTALDLNACITKVTGKSPKADEWNQWLALHESHPQK